MKDIGLATVRDVFVNEHEAWRGIGIKKKNNTWPGLTTRFGWLWRGGMSGAQDVRQFIERTYNICDTHNETVPFGQHSREGAKNYYSIRDVHNRRFANR